MRTLSLYSRKWCHLCEQMERALDPWVSNGTLNLCVIDVDADPALEARFDELVPVLMDGDIEICRYRLDLQRLREVLSPIR